MGKETKISWADHTGNPWVGCSVAHTGCLNCYARDFSQKKHGKVRGPWALWGAGQDRLVTKGFWTDVLKWAKAARQDGVRRTLFASLMDPLDPEVYERDAAPDGVACRETFDQYMDVLDEVMPFGAGLPGLVPLILTKRPEYWDRIPQRVRAGSWLLYSASDQPSLDAGMPHLLAAEGFAGLGLSLEPLVGPVDLAPWLCNNPSYGLHQTSGRAHLRGGAAGRDADRRRGADLAGCQEGAMPVDGGSGFASVQESARREASAHRLPDGAGNGGREADERLGASPCVASCARAAHARAGHQPQERPEVRQSARQFGTGYLFGERASWGARASHGQDVAPVGRGERFITTDYAPGRSHTREAPGRRTPGDAGDGVQGGHANDLENRTRRAETFWVIIGGESGRNARPCDVAWLRAIVRQCREAGVAPYVKQLGRRVLYGYDATEMTMPDGHGGDMLSWPSDLRVQEFPEGLR